MADEDNSLWFVLYCAVDDSFCLVPHTDVICDPSVKIGDLVQFIYGSRRKTLTGEVKAKGDDLDQLKNKMKKLNQRPQKTSSFHAERPRRAKASCNSLFNSCPKADSSKALKGKSKHDGAVDSPTDNLSQVKKAKVVSDSESDVDYKTVNKSSDNCEVPFFSDIDKDDSATSTEAELDDAEVQRILKEARRKKAKDLKCLGALSAAKKIISSPLPKLPETVSAHVPKLNKVFVDGESHVSPLAKVRASGASLDKVGGCESNIQKIGKESSLQNKEVQKSKSSRAGSFSSSSDEEQLESKPSEPTSTLPPPLKTVSRKRKTFYSKLVYEGTFFNYTEAGQDVTQLTPPYKIYVDNKRLREVKRESKSATFMARRLTPLVFTADAIFKCSTAGRPSSARPGVPSVIRPPLSSDGINAIYEYCKSRASRSHWPEPSMSSIKRAILDVCNETRYTAKLRREAKEKEINSVKESMKESEEAVDQPAEEQDFSQD